MSHVLNLLLTHQAPACAGRMIEWWTHCCPPEDLLLAYSGEPGEFDRIPCANKVLIGDPRLRTSRHALERQSYTGVVQAASKWLAGKDYTHVHFAEYDHLPLIGDLNARQLAFLAQEKADLLAFQLRRVDGTNLPHYLYHAVLPGFSEHWQETSMREDRKVILSMFGSGSFWTREAFDAVARQEEPFPIYLELYLPTLTHHLGFRVRGWPESDLFIRDRGDFISRIESARQQGAWSLHPVKTLWDQPLEERRMRGMTRSQRGEGGDPRFQDKPRQQTSG